MKKNYLLDTNVLLHDPEALFNFEDNNVYLSIEVLAELDKFKKGSDEINAHAREANRNLEKLSREGIKPEGMELTSGGRLFFLVDPSETIPVQKETEKRHGELSELLH